jgi:hypothetical protein
MRDFDVNVEPINFQIDSKMNCLLVEWPGNVYSWYFLYIDFFKFNFF